MAISCHYRSLNSSSDRQGDKPPILPSTIKLDRRPSLSLFIRDFREDGDHGSSDTDKESIDYHVQSPPIPDNQPLDPAISASVEEQHVSNSLFTGGRNSVGRAHLMDKMIESVADRPQIAGAKGPSCAMPGCDSKAMSDERRGDLLPCACDFKICVECFTDAMKIGGGFCPGCKEPYKPTDLEKAANGSADGQRLPLPSSPAMSKGERRLSIMRSLTRASGITTAGSSRQREPMAMAMLFGLQKAQGMKEMGSKQYCLTNHGGLSLAN